MINTIQHQYVGFFHFRFGAAFELKNLFISLYLVRCLLTNALYVLKVALHVQQERVEHLVRLRLDMDGFELTECLVARPPQVKLLVHFEERVLRLLGFQ